MFSKEVNVDLSGTWLIKGISSMAPLKKSERYISIFPIASDKKNISRYRFLWGECVGILNHPFGVKEIKGYQLCRTKDGKKTSKTSFNLIMTTINNQLIGVLHLPHKQLSIPFRSRRVQFKLKWLDKKWNHITSIGWLDIRNPRSGVYEAYAEGCDGYVTHFFSATGQFQVEHICEGEIIKNRVYQIYQVGPSQYKIEFIPNLLLIKAN